jgi:hypothetical protein
MVLSVGLYLILSIFVHPGTGMPGDQPGGETVTGASEFRYKAGPGDSKEVSEALALFGAKYKAVALSAKYLSHKMLLGPFDNKQMEIFCLVADEIDAEVVDLKRVEKESTYYAKIRYKVTVRDFIKSEIRDLELENKESNFSYDREMEQPVADTISPGQELSRAYRYIRRGQKRISIIYLDHLSKKYPHWGDVYLARAIGFYIMNDHRKMMEDLKTACALSNQAACDHLEAPGHNQGNILKLIQ